MENCIAKAVVCKMNAPWGAGGSRDLIASWEWRGVSLSCSGYGDVACFEGGGVSQSDNMTGQKERAECNGENKTAASGPVRPLQVVPHLWIGSPREMRDPQ